MDGCDVLLVLSSTSTCKPGSHKHTVHRLHSVQCDGVQAERDQAVTNTHIEMHTLIIGANSHVHRHTCTADSTHKHTVEISVTFSSASNVKNSMLIPCFPQRGTEQGTECPSLSSYFYRSHLVDGLIEQRKDTQRQRGKEAQVLENETTLILICRGGLVARVTFSFSCASILSR